MEWGIKAQYEIPLQTWKLWKSLKFNFHQNNSNFKAYVCFVKAKGIHTYPNMNESTKIYAWRQVAQGCICILLV